MESIFKKKKSNVNIKEHFTDVQLAIITNIVKRREIKARIEELERVYPILGVPVVNKRITELKQQLIKKTKKENLIKYEFDMIDDIALQIREV